MDDHEDEKELIARLHSLHRSVVRWLGVVILTAVVGIITIAFLDSSLLDYFGPGQAEDAAGTNIIASRGSQTDQAVAILGNIASAGIGGLVGWVTRDFTLRYRGVRLNTPPTKEQG